MFSLPFQVVVPTFLPHGMKLVGVYVNYPPSMFDEEGRRRNTRVQLNYSNEEQTDGFQLYESIAVSHIGDSGLVKIMIGEVEGEMLEEEERRLISLAWPGNGIGYSLTAFMRGSLTKEEVIRIAESTLAEPQ